MTHTYTTDESATPTRIGGIPPRVAAVVCYLPFSPFNLIMACICAFGEPRENRFLRLHGFQILFAGVAQLLFTLVTGVLNVVVAITTMDIFAMDAPPSAGPPDVELSTAFIAVASVEGILFFVFFAMLIMGLVQAARGRFFHIPVIGGLAERFA